MREQTTYSRLTTGHAPNLDVLRRAYAVDLGGPGASDERFCAALLADPRCFALGAWQEAELVGFAILFELPEAVFARHCGQMDDLFVLASHRGQGIAPGLISAATDLGRERGWTHLRWIAPPASKAGLALYRRLADMPDWTSFVIRLEPAASP